MNLKEPPHIFEKKLKLAVKFNCGQGVHFQRTSANKTSSKLKGYVTMKERQTSDKHHFSAAAFQSIIPIP